ncbi:MAG: alkaline phosphatase family protein [Nitriliruptoraceae bacterium]
MRIPAASSGSISAVLPAALSAVRGGSATPLSLPPDVSGVIVLVVDGLGRALLDQHAALAPTLTGAPGPTLDATFPTTTPTNLTSLGTGTPPIEHGIIGTACGVAGSDRPLISLTWRWDSQLHGPDARDDLPPEAYQPLTTVFSQALDHGIAATTVLEPSFAESGLTRAALRGGSIVAASGLDATLAAAVEAVIPGPAIAYAHHGDIDTAGHRHGPGSQAWCVELARADATLTRWREQLPPRVALVVIADHGMVEVPPQGLIDLAERPELLAGVRMLGGDPRARQLHVEPGARDEVAATWRAHAGATGRVVTREQAISAGWFGPAVRQRAGIDARIGDLLVLADTEVAWIHGERDPFGGRMPGQHGALSDAELLVPAVSLTSPGASS